MFDPRDRVDAAVNPNFFLDFLRRNLPFLPGTTAAAFLPIDSSTAFLLLENVSESNVRLLIGIPPTAKYCAIIYIIIPKVQYGDKSGRERRFHKHFQ